MQDRLSTVHDALTRASQEPPKQKESPVDVGSYRITATIKDAASGICQMHGTSLSAYLRNCIKLLVFDYTPNGRLPSGYSDQEK